MRCILFISQDNFKMAAKEIQGNRNLVLKQNASKYMNGKEIL